MKTSSSPARIAAYSLLVFMMVSSGCSACNLFKKKGGQSTSSNLSSESKAGAEEEIRNGTIGIKNMSQFGPALSAVTGVPMTATVNGTSLSELNENAIPWMSYDGTVGNVNASMLLTMTGLAGGFCSAFIERESALASSARKTHNSVDFAKGVDGLSEQVRHEIIGRYAKMFWRREPSSEERSILWDAMDEAVNAAQPSSSSATTAQKIASVKNTLLVACTATASSLEFIRE